MTELTPELLAAQALLYASGELDANQELRFERFLGQDQRARDALRRAAQVVFTQTADGLGKPDPIYRQRVKAHVFHRGWLSRLWSRREYHGHPAFWTGLGATAAAVLLLGLNLRSHPAPTNALADKPITRPAGDELPGPPVDGELVSVEEAETWANLPRAGEHLQKVFEDQQRSKQMAGKIDKLLKYDENRARSLSKSGPRY